jgi:hypothetical protein
VAGVLVIWLIDDDVVVDNMDILHVKRIYCDVLHKYMYRGLATMYKETSGILKELLRCVCSEGWQTRAVLKIKRRADTIRFLKSKLVQALDNYASVLSEIMTDQPENKYCIFSFINTSKNILVFPQLQQKTALEGGSRSLPVASFHPPAVALPRSCHQASKN